MEWRKMDRGRFLLTLLATGCALLVLQFIFKTIYNVFFHPLRKVPGPFWAKVFPQYMAGSAMAQRRAHVLLELHKTFGPAVRIGPNEVSISDYRAYRQIYGQDASIKEESMYKGATLLGCDNILIIIDKVAHSGRRKMMSKPFSQRSINENEGLMTALVDRMLDRMSSEAKKSPTKTVNVLDIVKLFSFEVICQSAFNTDISSPSQEEAIKFLHAMEDCPIVLIVSTIMPFLRNWGLGQYLPGPVGHAFRQYKYFVSYTRQLYLEFKEKSDKSESNERFIATPLIYEDDTFLGRRLTEKEALEESMGIAFAGSGTTSNTIVYLLYELSRPQNRHMQLRLREEIQPVARSLANVKDLPYMNAVIRETMRLYPTIIGTLPRTLTSPVVVDNNLLPVGTTVGMQNYVHQRDPSIYPEPDTFRPERWLDPNRAGELDKAFTPYGVGSRNCIGQNLANAELAIAVSQIFRCLDISLDSAMTKDDMEMEDHFFDLAKGEKVAAQHFCA